ncbi:MAG: hypothetical protein QGG40_15770, partial [Myxococcota bacterium]|nr:hypothetical protein [Myxococcota bacterium]
MRWAYVAGKMGVKEAIARGGEIKGIVTSIEQKAAQWCSTSSKDLKKTYARSIYTREAGLDEPSDKVMKMTQARVTGRNPSEGMPSDPFFRDIWLNTMMTLAKTENDWLDGTDVQALEGDGPYEAFIAELVALNPYYEDCIRPIEGVTDSDLPEFEETRELATTGMDIPALFPGYSDRSLDQVTMKRNACQKAGAPNRGLHSQTKQGTVLQEQWKRAEAAHFVLEDHARRTTLITGVHDSCEAGPSAESVMQAEDAAQACEWLVVLWEEETALCTQLDVLSPSTA